jgi:DNA-binding HxlR family transcriptional regulator
MGSTHKKVSDKAVNCSIERVERAVSVIEGRWKLLILFHLFAEQPRRFSNLERAIPSVSQKMLIQQLRALEHDGVVRRVAYPEVPPRVEYSLTSEGEALQPALVCLQEWAAGVDLETPTRTFLG